MTKQCSLKGLPVNNVIPVVRGRYMRNQIEIAHREMRGMCATAAQRAEIDRIWALRRAENATIFDGLQVRLDGWQATAEKLLLSTSLTSYREFIGTNLNHPEWLKTLGDDFLSNPIGVSGTIKTADYFLIFGVRGFKVAEYSGYMDTIGGNLSPTLHLTDGKIDPFKAFISEVCEELTVTEPQINSVFSA